jgi:hypothetical protein
MGGMNRPEQISEAQHAALDKLAPALARSCYVAGGIAIAARLRHRPSRDLDLFTAADPTEHLSDLEAIPGVIVTGRARGTLHLTVDGVPVSILHYEYSTLLPTESVADIPIPLASLEDLACMKLSAIAGRGLARDFWDLHELLLSTGRTLDEYLAAFRRKYPAQDIGHVVRSLAYFGDADSQPLPLGLTEARWKEIRRDFEARVARLVTP